MLKTALTVAAVSAGVLLPATGAHAWSAGYANGITTFTAGGDEVNKTQIAKVDAVMMRLTDSGGSAGASAGCGTGNGVTDCPIGNLVRLFLSDEKDVVLTGDALFGAGVSLNIAAGTGNDTISNGKLSGALGGEEGTDIIRPGEGKDTVNGGTGLDAIDYSDRSAAVKLFMVQGTAEVAPGEQDTFNGIEVAFGGAGDDQLVGSEGNEQFIPGDGKDTVLGAGGTDIIDALDCGKGTDTALTDQFDATVDCETVAMKNTALGGGGIKANPPAPEDLPGGETGEVPSAGAPSTAPTAPASTPTATPGGSSPAADRTAPKLTKLRLSKRTISRKQATKLKFTLSEPAAVSITVERCAATKRKTKRCALPTRVATVKRSKLSGAVALKLTRKLPERTLKRGRYRLKVTAIDAAGNRSAAGTTLLTVR
jgi:hypothetical protein